MASLDFSRKAKSRLLAYNFPGNVRELKAVIELAAVLSDGKQIEEEDIRFNSPKKATEFLSSEMTFEEYKRKIIHHYLKRYDNAITLVAQKLDIGKSTIYRMLKNEKDFAH